ncbi:MAG: aspartate/glutamate racemase family protein [Neisseria sp.]|nr:aspartate/glutamate racemase family protein [Neisseria sp.]
MKKIGLIGGMSFESTLTYYRLLNEKINARLGGLHSAKIMLESVEFDEIARYQRQNEWDKAAVILNQCARNLAACGADFILLCTNTMHKVYPAVQHGVAIPLIHIAHGTINALHTANMTKVGLLGTRYTMEQDFYRDELIRAGIEVMVPAADDRELINHVIFNELCVGKIEQSSKAQFLRIAQRLAGDGAQGMILGCTEIGLLLTAHDTDIPLFDTTLLHIDEAVRLALA